MDLYIDAIITEIIEWNVLARLKNLATVILAESDTSVLSNVKIAYNINISILITSHVINSSTKRLRSLD